MSRTPLLLVALASAMVACLVSDGAQAQRPRPRIRVTPAYPYSYYSTPFPKPYPYEYPGPGHVRQCTSWLAQEARPSGTVIVPQMRCWWVPGSS